MGKKSFLGVVVLVVLFGAFYFMRGQRKEGVPGQNKSTQPQPAGLALTVCSVGNPHDWRPSLLTDTVSANVNDGVISEGLLKPDDKTGAPGMWLATSFTYEPATHSYLVSLRHGVHWHPAEKYMPKALAAKVKPFKPTRDFNAEDVLYTYTYQHDPNSPLVKAAPEKYFLWKGQNMDNFLKGVEPVKGADGQQDMYKVRFVIKQVDMQENGVTKKVDAIGGDALRALLSQGFLAISSKEENDWLVANGLTQYADTFWANSGTGPWMTKSFKERSRLVLVRAPDYWQPVAANFSSIKFRIVRDANTRMLLLKSGDCLITTLSSPSQIRQVQQGKAPGLQLIKGPSLTSGYLILVDKDMGKNASGAARNPLSDVRVRRAVSLSLNLKADIKAVAPGTSFVPLVYAPSVLWRGGVPVTAAERPYLGYDVPKAKALLKEAGFSQGFDMTLQYVPVIRAYMPQAKKLAALFQADLAQVGIRAHPLTKDWRLYLSQLYSADKEALLYMNRTKGEGEPRAFMAGVGWIEDFASKLDTYTLWASDAVPGNNWPGFSDPTYDRLLDEVRRENDPQKAEKLYKKLDDILYEDMSSIPIVEPIGFVLASKKLNGVMARPVSPVTNFSGIVIH